MPNSETSTEIQTFARDLVVALGTTAPFAAEPGYGLPAIEAVQLVIGDGALVALATNRYVVGYARQEAKSERTVRFLLDVTQARAIRRTLASAIKEAETDRFPVVLTITEGSKRTMTVAFEPYWMTSQEAAGVDSAPDLGKIIAEQTQSGATPAPGPVGLQAGVLRPFLKASKWAFGEPMRWTFGDAMKPARVEIGDWFIGLAMPTNLREKQRPVDLVIPTVEQVSSVTRPYSSSAGR